MKKKLPFYLGYVNLKELDKVDKASFCRSARACPVNLDYNIIR
jgi:hypothetical protein